MADFQAPNGSNFASDEDIDASKLSNILCKVAAFIQRTSPYIRLEKYDDWWEHDGLHFYDRSILIEDLFEIVRSPKSLLESVSGEFNVFVGIYSTEIPFYLRFYVDWNDDETNLIGRFDLTIPQEMAERFRDEIVQTSEVEMQEMASEKYYQSIIL